MADMLMRVGILQDGWDIDLFGIAGKFIMVRLVNIFGKVRKIWITDMPRRIGTVRMVGGWLG